MPAAPRRPRASTRSRTRATAPQLDRLDLHHLTPATASDLVDSAALDDVEVTDLQIDYLDLRHATVHGSRLSQLGAASADLAGARLAMTALHRLDIPNVSAARAGWRDVEITDSRLGSLEAYESTWNGVRFTDTRLGYVNLRGATLQDVVIEGTTIDELDLVQATARRVSFSGARIGRLDVQHATLEHVDLRGAELGEVVGIESLRGIVVTPSQLIDLAPVLAFALGIVVAEPGAPLD